MKSEVTDPSYTEDWLSTKVQQQEKIIFLINDAGTTGYEKAKKFNFDPYTSNIKINSK